MKLLYLYALLWRHNYGVNNLYELAEYVQLSEEHVLEILNHYKNKYGIGTHYGEYLITFDPLRVLNIKKYKQRRFVEWKKIIIKSKNENNGKNSKNTNSNKVNLRKERLAMGLWRLSSFVYINNNRYVCLYC